MQEIRTPTKNSVLKGQYDWLGYVGWAKMSVWDSIGTNALHILLLVNKNWEYKFVD